MGPSGRCLTILLLLSRLVHVGNFHVAGEVWIMPHRLLATSETIMGGVESARIAVQPVVIIFDWVLGIVGSGATTALTASIVVISPPVFA